MSLFYAVIAGFGVALLFSLAVFIHELGHFVAARLLGLQVDTFSIGFGPAIWKKRINGIEYKLCWILFGGYVALPQLDPSGMEKVQGKQGEEDAEDDAEARDLPDVAPWKRIVVSVAGPFGNVALAVVLAAVIALWPGEFMSVTSTNVGYVEQESEAFAAGLREGDRVLAINGNKVNSWHEMLVEFQLAGKSGSVAADVMRGEDKLSFAMPLSTNNFMQLLIPEGVYPDGQSIVGKINEGSPAEKAGILINDVILAKDGTPVMGASHFVNLVKKSAGSAINLNILREGSAFNVTVTPEFYEEEQRYLIGIMFSMEQVDVKPWMAYKGFYAQLKWDCLSVFRVLGGLVSPKSEGERGAIAKNLGGPVMIITMLYGSVRSGFLESLGLLRMLCINLAILNLLPLPVLDGGHVCFALYEVVTRRKPHPKVVAGLVNGFAILLIGLMIFLVFRDGGRIANNRKKIEKARESMAEEAKK